jgi:hypothetical protein
MTDLGGNQPRKISPQDALRYNAHPDQLMREVPEEEWGRVLRAIEREVLRWKAQQTPLQREWVDRRRRMHYLGTEAAAKEIVKRLSDGTWPRGSA